mgnify:CR=1 FL=1
MPMSAHPNVLVYIKPTIIFHSQIFPRTTFIMNMKTFEILSETADGNLVAVVSTEATSEEEAILATANFCNMMDIEVHSVRESF